MVLIDLVVAGFAVLLLLRPSWIDKLQSQELALDPGTRPATFEALNALLILISALQLYDLLCMERDSYYPLLDLLPVELFRPLFGQQHQQ